MVWTVRLVSVASFLALAFLFSSSNGPTQLRADTPVSGPIVLYDFSNDEGPIVSDRSGFGRPLDLLVGDQDALRRSPGSLKLLGKTEIRSDQPATKLTEAVRRSGAFTAEVWLQPDGTKAAGPARIVTISRNSNERNFTLGQEGNQFDIRLRTTKTSTNGIPSLATRKGTVKTELMHVVYTFARDGQAHVYINGKAIESQKIAGTTSNWDNSFRLILGDELGGGRPWPGTLHLVALYDRALSGNEVQTHFKAGHKQDATALTLTRDAKRLAELNARHFETNVAPILAQHCLECHDGVTKQGKLDLSTEATAFAGGRDGPAIIPGIPEKSSLWYQVESNDMPKKHPPLSGQEKRHLRQWILNGCNGRSNGSTLRTMFVLVVMAKIVSVV